MEECIDCGKVLAANEILEYAAFQICPKCSLIRSENMGEGEFTGDYEESILMAQEDLSWGV